MFYRNMRTNIIVIDDFYIQVMNTRNFILSEPNKFSTTGNYPGLRTKSFATESIKAHFQKIIGKEITYFSTDPSSYNGAFQYTTAGMKSWIHRDCTDWAGLVYLTPDNLANVNSGTNFYRHKETGLEELPPNAPEELKKKLDDDSNDFSKWDLVDSVGNKFNRLVLFRGTRSHMSGEYFGTDKHNGRLFQIFFFNEKKVAPLTKSITIPKNKTVNTSTKTINATDDITINTSTNKNITISNNTSNKQIILPGKLWKPSRRLKVTLLIFTTSRYDYLIPTLESMYEQVDFSDVDVYTMLIDDNPVDRDIGILMDLKNKYGIDEIMLNEKNLGYSLSWKRAWASLPFDTDYVWHQEDDFIYNKKVNVFNMIRTLMTCPTTLTQLVLKRQVWFETNDFITKIESGKVGREVCFGSTDDKDVDCVTIHQYYFNANPCVYPYWVTQEEYSHNPQESVIASDLRKKYPDRYSAFYGEAKGEAYVKHIGEYTIGKKCLEGEPGWSYLKKYDPDKKYYSKKYLTEWDK